MQRRTSWRWVWFCTSCSSLKCLSSRPITSRALEQASAHGAHRANDWVIIFWKRSFDSTWPEETNLFERQPQEQASSYGHMESAHVISLLSIFEETSMIEWSLQAHGCVWPDFKINFKNNHRSLQVKQCSCAHAWLSGIHQWPYSAITMHVHMSSWACLPIWFISFFFLSFLPDLTIIFFAIVVACWCMCVPSWSHGAVTSPGA